MLRVRLARSLFPSRLVGSVRYRSNTLPIYIPTNSTLPAGAELPPVSEWRKYIPVTGSQMRVSLCNDDSADRLVNDMIPPINSGGKKGKGKTVVEAFPGPGVITRALMRLPRERVEKIYVMEEHEGFLPYLLVCLSLIPIH